MRRQRRGFTLVELLVVMTIIGILLSLVLKAYSGGVRRAEEKATVALIAKLEQAMTDRVDALTTYRAEPTPIHIDLATLYSDKSRDPVTKAFIPIRSVQRAQAIAQFDYMRAQLPDVFYRQSTATTAGSYPFNFAGASAAVPIGADNGVNGTIAGAYGAAFEIAGGLYKQLGYHPEGYDGSDNNGDGNTDDAFEGTNKLSAAEKLVVADRLSKHTHKTARSEMLYAILVEGGGTYGSAFDKDDFTAREVQDTDGDGLMEFVDAWGEPLQFYRWPILYRSDSQKGYPDTAKLIQDRLLGGAVQPGPYNAAISGASAYSYESREQNPIDPNQTLMSPAWWGSGWNDAPAADKPAWMAANDVAHKISGQAITFMGHFGPCLVDPSALNAAGPSPTFWDRSTTDTTGYYLRRAFYSRFLILSGGPDKMPGTARIGVNYGQSGTDPMDDRATIDTPTAAGSIPYTSRDGSGAPVGVTIPMLLMESQGGKVDLNRDALGRLTTFGANGRNDTNSLLEYFSQDDISSQNLQATGGVLQ